MGTGASGVPLGPNLRPMSLSIPISLLDYQMTDANQQYSFDAQMSVHCYSSEGEVDFITMVGQVTVIVSGYNSLTVLYNVTLHEYPLCGPGWSSSSEGRDYI